LFVNSPRKHQREFVCNPPGFLRETWWFFVVKNFGDCEFDAGNAYMDDDGGMDSGDTDSDDTDIAYTDNMDNVHCDMGDKDRGEEEFLTDIV
jgi:hypothetical protein